MITCEGRSGSSSCQRAAHTLPLPCAPPVPAGRPRMPACNDSVYYSSTESHIPLSHNESGTGVTPTSDGMAVIRVLTNGESQTASGAGIHLCLHLRQAAIHGAGWTRPQCSVTTCSCTNGEASCIKRAPTLLVRARLPWIKHFVSDKAPSLQAQVRPT